MNEITIRDLTSFIGNVVATGEAVPWTPIRYKYLEFLKNWAFMESFGVSDTLLCLDKGAECLIK